MKRRLLKNRRSDKTRRAKGGLNGNTSRKRGVVTIGGTAIGNVTGYTLDTTQDVVEDTALEDSTNHF